MPTISVEQRVLEALMSDAGHVHNVASLEEQLPLLGTDIDRCDEVTLDIEIFPTVLTFSRRKRWLGPCVRSFTTKR